MKAYTEQDEDISDKSIKGLRFINKKRNCSMMLEFGLFSGVYPTTNSIELNPPRKNCSMEITRPG